MQLEKIFTLKRALALGIEAGIAKSHEWDGPRG
jgi:hypothetical protein